MEEESLFEFFNDSKESLDRTLNLVDIDNDIEYTFKHVNKDIAPLSSPVLISSVDVDSDALNTGVIANSTPAVNNIELNNTISKINNLINNNQFEQAQIEMDNFATKYIMNNYGLDEQTSKEVYEGIKNPISVFRPEVQDVISSIKKNKKDKFLNSQILNYNIKAAKSNPYLSSVSITPESAIERRLVRNLGDYTVSIDNYLNNNYRKKLAEDSSLFSEVIYQTIGAFTRAPGVLLEIGGGIFNDAYSTIENLVTDIKYLGYSSDNELYKQEILSNFKYQVERQEAINKSSNNLKYWWGFGDFAAPMTSADDLSGYSTLKDYTLGTYSLLADFFAPQAALGTVTKILNYASKGLKGLGGAMGLGGAGEKALNIVGNTSNLGLGLLTGRIFSNIVGSGIYSFGKKVLPSVFKSLDEEIIKNSIFMSYLEYSSNSINNRLNMFEYLKSKGYNNEDAAYEAYVSDVTSKYLYVLATSALNLGEAKRITNPLISETSENLINRFTKESIRNKFEQLKKESIQSYWKESIKEGIEEVFDPLSQAVGMVLGSSIDLKTKMEDEFTYKNFIDTYLTSFLGGALGSLPNVAMNNILGQSEKFHELSQKYKLLGMLPVNSPYAYLKQAQDFNNKVMGELSKYDELGYENYKNNIVEVNKDLEQLRTNIKEYEEKVKEVDTSIGANIETNIFQSIKKAYNSLGKGTFISNPINTAITSFLSDSLNSSSGLVNGNDLLDLMNMTDSLDSMNKNNQMSLSNNSLYKEMQNSFGYKLIKSLQLLTTSATSIPDIKSLIEYKNNLLKSMTTDNIGNKLLKDEEIEIADRIMTTVLSKSYMGNNLGTVLDDSIIQDILNIEFDNDLYESFAEQNGLNKGEQSTLLLFALDRIQNGSHDTVEILDNLNLLNKVNTKNSNLLNKLKIYNDDKVNNTNNSETITQKEREDKLNAIFNNRGISNGGNIIVEREARRKQIKQKRNRFGINNKYELVDRSTFKKFVLDKLKINETELKKINIDIDNLSSKDVQKILEHALSKNISGILFSLQINQNKKEIIKQFILNTFTTPNDLLFAVEFINYLVSNLNENIEILNSQGQDIITIREFIFELSNYITDDNRNTSATKGDLIKLSNNNNSTLDKEYNKEVQKGLSNINQSTLFINNNTYTFGQILSSIANNYASNDNVLPYKNNKDIVDEFRKVSLNSKYNSEKVISKEEIFLYIFNSVNNELSSTNIPLDLKPLTVSGDEVVRLMTPTNQNKLVLGILENKKLLEISDNMDEMIMGIRARAFAAMKFGTYNDYRDTIQSMIDVLRNEYEKSIEKAENKDELMMLFEKKIYKLNEELNLMEKTFKKNADIVYELLDNIKDSPDKINQLLVDIINNMDLTDTEKKELYIQLGDIVSSDGNMNNLLNNLVSVLVEEDLKIKESLNLKKNTEEETQFFMNAIESMGDYKANESALRNLDTLINSTISKGLSALSKKNNLNEKQKKLEKQLKELQDEFIDVTSNIKHINYSNYFPKIKTYYNNYKNGKITKEEFLKHLKDIYDEFDTDYNVKVLDVLRSYYEKLSNIYAENKDVIADENQFEVIKEFLDKCVKEMNRASQHLRDIGIVQGILYNDLIDERINKLQSRYNDKLNKLKEIMGTKDNFWKNLLNNIWSKKTYISNKKMKEIKQLIDIDKNKKKLFNNFNLQQLNVCS